MNVNKDPNENVIDNSLRVKTTLRGSFYQTISTPAEVIRTKTVFRCLSRFVVGSSLVTKMSVFVGKFVPSFYNN